MHSYIITASLQLKTVMCVALCYSEGLLAKRSILDIGAAVIFWLISSRNTFLDQPFKCLQRQCNGDDDPLVSEIHLALSGAITNSYTQVTTFEHIENSYCKICSCVTVSGQ